MDKVIERIGLAGECKQCSSRLERVAVERDSGSGEFEQFYAIVDKCLNLECTEEREMAHGIAYIPGYGVV